MKKLTKEVREKILEEEALRQRVLTEEKLKDDLALYDYPTDYRMVGNEVRILLAGYGDATVIDARLNERGKWEPVEAEMEQTTIEKVRSDDSIVRNTTSFAVLDDMDVGGYYARAVATVRKTKETIPCIVWVSDDGHIEVVEPQPQQEEVTSDKYPQLSLTVEDRDVGLAIMRNL